MGCKLKYLNHRRVSEPVRAFRLTLRKTGISDDWYRSTVEVIVILLVIPQSAGENFKCT